MKDLSEFKDRLAPRLEEAGLRFGTRDDIPQVVDVLSRAMEDDPHMKWTFGSPGTLARSRPGLDFQVRVALNTGFCLISDDGLGAALWETEQQERLSAEYVFRTLNIVRKLGLRRALRANATQEEAHEQHDAARYFYLSILGVHPDAQGRGLGGTLMRPVLQLCSDNAVQAYLETANPKNVAYYERKGFRLSKTIDKGAIQVFCMRLLPAA